VPFYIEKMPEPEAEAPLLPLPAPIKEKYGKFVPLAKVGASVLLATIALLVMRRSLRTRRARLDALRLQELESQERIAKMQLEAAKVEEPPPPEIPVDYRAEALRRATDDPATAALVLRHWLSGYELQQNGQKNAAA
jgi:flagellar biosynthesis/type III secretory pathway M-ring protein FliF/YscJ